MAGAVGVIPAGLGVPPLVSIPVGVLVLYGIVQFFGKSTDVPQSEYQDQVAG